VSTVRAGIRDELVFEDAIDVLASMPNTPVPAIPAALLRDAQGVAIIPGVIKAGFVIGGRHGRGVLLTRTQDGAWSRPEFITLSGGSIGWQIGVQSTDIILVFKTRRGLDRIRKGKLTLGADVAVAAGPVGVQAEAGTDAKLQAEIYSYSRSRGLFAGLSVEGGVLLLEPTQTANYYRDEQAGQQAGRLPMTTASIRLQMRVAQMTAPPLVFPAPPPLAPVLPPPVAPPPPFPAAPVPVAPVPVVPPAPVPKP
jgi:lipid-binding SYLF domain-containing protein